MNDLCRDILESFASFRRGEEHLVSLIPSINEMVGRLAGDDAWLVSWVKERFTYPSGMGAAEAVAVLACRNESPGMHRRLRREGALTAIRAPELVEPRQWFRELPVDSLEYISDMSFEAAYSFLEQFEELGQEGVHREEWYQRMLRRFLEEVDTYQCMRVCLAFAPLDASRFNTMMDTIDDLGEVFMVSLLAARTETSEQLRRAVLPDAWWTSSS